MISLLSVAGLPIQITDDCDDFAFSFDEVKCSSSKDIPLLEILPSLLNKALRYPEIVYSHHSHVMATCDETNWPASHIYDLIYLPVGLLGIEFIKTHTFYTPEREGKAACIVQVLMGMLTVVMQKNKPKRDMFDIETHVQDAMVIEVSAGEKMLIPTGYYYTFANSTEQPILFARVVSHEHMADYRHFQRENGLAYYLIAKNARAEVVTNPRYRSLVEVRRIGVDALNHTFGYKQSSTSPLYHEALREVQKVEMLLAA